MSPKEEALYQLDASDVRAGQRWKHNKTGGVYTIIATGLAEATLAPVVIYAGRDGIVWVRALAVFLGNNETHSPRFSIVPNNDTAVGTAPFQRVAFSSVDLGGEA